MSANFIRTGAVLAFLAPIAGLSAAAAPARQAPPKASPVAAPAHAAAPVAGPPAGPAVYVVGPGSQALFVVKARSLVFPVTVRGRGGRVQGILRLGPGPSPSVSALLTITASTLATGIRARDAKMRKVLEVPAFPYIVVGLSGKGAFTAADLDGPGVTVTARGYLEVAGTRASVSFPVYARRAGGKLLVRGMASTGFKALGLHRPGLGFLVAVHDPILAGADLVALPRASGGPQSKSLGYRQVATAKAAIPSPSSTPASTAKPVLPGESMRPRSPSTR